MIFRIFIPKIYVLYNKSFCRSNLLNFFFLILTAYLLSNQNYRYTYRYIQTSYRLADHRYHRHIQSNSLIWRKAYKRTVHCRCHKPRFHQALPFGYTYIPHNHRDYSYLDSRTRVCIYYKFYLQHVLCIGTVLRLAPNHNQENLQQHRLGDSYNLEK